ncbi:MULTISPECIES: cupin domain-containing protein [unclassified Pseudomonas]|uniref:cupin domain-containing protein n=1 Tax=unclassified Pseudomonas TaxID=196821 RepID=UPI000BD1BFE5|nr:MULTISPECIES: cupin domain-containing protein [unclassified Pseudomonas]PVZ19656.1 Cupin domain-containing protein [Pseudomonas sp. URIL14HWK12:I12]PVZ22759.1 Cupin domain-containing protein [Pseudomonas sp. URIL14HWK12:I10]PVZ37611.1 Cupin domain-containing protein [Pseudomonas sp. URIL14HWK12:I11]SNZ15247.1 Cupin domain-containing protein [Pseudomonas sp. URIL14HWK12:I9]
MQPLPPVKRVVTGHDAIGKAVITEQGPAPAQFPIPAVPGMHFQEIWNTGALPVALDNAADPTLRPLQLAPMPHSGLIRVVDIPPDSIQNQASDEAIAATLAAVGAPAAEPNGRHKLMHRTQTLDYGILVQGELWLMLDDEEVRLSPGDVVVQRGTRHAWSNRTEQVARIVFILQDGYYAEGVTPRQP